VLLWITKNIQIPIKGIVERAAKKHGCVFDFYDMLYIRKFFIACLNYGYLEPEDLEQKCDVFCSRLKEFVPSTKENLSPINPLYKIDNGVLYIASDSRDTSEDYITIAYFKAFMQVLLGWDGKCTSVEETLCSIAAEHLYVMDVDGNRIVLPKSDHEYIADKIGKLFELTLRSGYRQFNYPISMLKMFFVIIDCNENMLTKNMLNSSFNEQFDALFKSKDDMEVLKQFNELFIMYISRINGKPSTEELEAIKRYSLLLTDIINEVGPNSFAFFALIPDDEIRNLAFAKLESKFTDD
jgi:hypothetical protein